MTIDDILRNLNETVLHSNSIIADMNTQVAEDPMKFLRWHTDDLAIACIEKEHAVRYINFINQENSGSSAEASRYYTDEEKIDIITKDILNLIIRNSPNTQASPAASLVDNYAVPFALRNIYQAITGHFA